MTKPIYGMCCKCFDITKLTRHHIYPRRFFPNSKKVCFLCRQCHSDFHQLLPMDKKRPARFYEEFLRAWLKGGMMVRYQPFPGKENYND